MTSRQFVWGAAFAAALCGTLIAQQAPSNFYSVRCVKVKPGKSAEFNTFTNGDSRKLEQSFVDSGVVSMALELRTVIPAGAEAKCDYVFVQFYPGLPPAPMSDAETAAALNKAGISLSQAQWREEENNLRYLVSNSIARSAVSVGRTKAGDYIVVNDMEVPDTGAWIADQKKLWQPIFEDAVKTGAMDGWSATEQFMPRGEKDQNITGTVDIYPDWKSVYTFFGASFPDRWKRIHPDVPIAQGMAQEHKSDTIEHTILYKVVSELQPSK
jgi:hypothetical protein